MRLAVRLHENQSHPRRRPPQGDVRVLPADEPEARLLADLQRAGIQCHLRREGGRGDFLRQHMRAVPQNPVRCGQGGKRQSAVHSIEIRAPIAHELPLQPQRIRKIITALQRKRRLMRL